MCVLDKRELDLDGDLGLGGDIWGLGDVPREVEFLLCDEVLMGDGQVSLSSLSFISWSPYFAIDGPSARAIGIKVNTSCTQ